MAEVTGPGEGNVLSLANPVLHRGRHRPFLKYFALRSRPWHPGCSENPRRFEKEREMTSKNAPVIFALFGVLAVAALPASAQYRHHRYYGSDRDGEFRLRVGAFRPDGSSDYWDGIRSDFTGPSPTDFQAP